MLKSTKNFIIILFIVGILIVIGGVYFLTSNRVPVEEVRGTANFEECVSAGNPVLESYPRQCNDKAGNHFTEFIGNSLEKIDKIILTSPRPNDVVTSPLVIKGQAKGSWFFEASFPVSLTDWDGKIIAQGIAQAQSDWMTENFVPYVATLTYVLEPSYSNKGTLILKKDNPSGEPQNDDALEIPVLLK